MGRDKATLSLADGRTLAADAVARLRAACPEVVIADRGRGTVDGIRSVMDGLGHGPVAGLLGVATAFPGRDLVALACDLPRVPAPLLTHLVSSAGFDWLVPRHEGRLEPLCARYGTAALRALRERAERGRFALKALDDIESLRIGYVEGAWLGASPSRTFANLNTPGDLEHFRRS